MLSTTATSLETWGIGNFQTDPDYF